ncbi:hypothetical protein ACQKIE_17620, partial [Luteibacter sp. NPDC031894]|uniref:hypothetical protein n=1 Tax=Luteibacter sp. NPDC031894 TaxID=3390572 RepID=UPI003CFC7908
GARRGSPQAPSRASALPTIVSANEHWFIPLALNARSAGLRNAKPIAKKPHDSITSHLFLRNGWKW